MSDPIDDLLAQIQSEPVSQATPPNNSANSSEQTSGKPKGSIDSLLANLEGMAKPAPKPTQVPQPFRSTNPHFDALIRQPAKQSAELVTPKPAPVKPAPVKPALTEPLLADIKALYQEQDQAEALKQQEQLRAEQERQEILKRQRQAAIVRQAQAWLKSLDAPKNAQSGELAWFEEFAAKYSSRVEAAIDYLGLQGD